MRRRGPSAVWIASAWIALLLLAGGPTANAQEDLAAVAGMIESGRLAPAEQALRRVLAGAESAPARDLLGVVLGRTAREKEAEEQFLRALETDPDYAPARQHLARLYLGLERQGEALEQLRQAARLGALERDLGLRLASFERAAGDLDAAEAQLASVAERHDSARALVELARIRSERGHPEEAVEILRRALEIAPNSETVLSAHARVSLAARAPIPAIWTLEHLERMHPGEADYAYLLGVARMQVGEMTGAAEALREAFELTPDRALTLIALGIALNGQKRFDEAREVLARSLLLDPGNVEALAAIAESQEGLGELEAAERNARSALARVEAHPRAHLVIGKIRMTQRRYAEARDALERAVAADPTSAKGHYQLSLALARLGDAEGSRRHLELYRAALAEAEERLLELRARTGVTGAGMSG